MDFQVKYHFDADSKDKSGETVLELVEGNTREDVARIIEQAMTQPTFAVYPMFGPAKEAGIVVINTSAIRFVEIAPVSPPRSAL